MSNSDSLSVTLFLISLAAAFYIQTLRPEVWRVRVLMWTTTAILLLLGLAWPFLIGNFPTFAVSDFVISATDLASNAWAWFFLVIATAIIGSLDSVIKQWWANRLPASPVATALLPSIEASTEGDVSLALSQKAGASTTIDTGQVPPAVVFVVEESWIDYTPGRDFPLKLWVRWANEGVDIDLGKLRWAANKIHPQGRRTGQEMMFRFKYRSGTEEIEANSMLAPHGKRGEIWVGLDSSFDVEQVRRWKEAKQLGLLVLPITIGWAERMKMEIQIQL